MKNRAGKHITFSFLLLILILHSVHCISQDSIQKAQVALKWAPTGLIAGNISLLVEYGFGKHSSLTAKLGIPVKVSHQLKYDGDDTRFSSRAMSFMAGYRRYLSQKQLKGFYLEPYFKYVHHSSEGKANTTLDGEAVLMQFNNDYNAAGIGVELGIQFLINERMAIDFFFLGPEINWARNNFKAVETTNNSAWTYAQAREAEYDIREFLDDVPFLKNKTTILVNQDERTVMADFKGVLPGYRIGLSFGIRL
ncbi:MAG: DUF3575 domain-containing protein [Chitinophagaceae bacterium]|nr:DUF3575 domain-containing protein [Chitinophagaceae bacterium]